MSPTQALRHPEEHSRLFTSNFEIWKTRVTAALEGEGLLGFTPKPNYNGDPGLDSESEMLEEANKYFDQLEISSASNPSPSLSVDPAAASGSVNENADTEMQEADLPVVQSFTDMKKDEFKRAVKIKATYMKKLRTKEAQANAYLVKTLDDTNIRLLQGKTTVFEIFQMICSRYENTSVHGDPYWIQDFLTKFRYEEGTDVTTFFELEKATKAISESTESAMSNQQRSIYPYHVLPGAW